MSSPISSGSPGSVDSVPGPGPVDFVPGPASVLGVRSNFGHSTLSLGRPNFCHTTTKHVLTYRKTNERERHKGITHINERKREAQKINETSKRPRRENPTQDVQKTSTDSNSILATHTFSDNLNILFSNIDGIRSKWNDLVALSQSDHVLCLNELNLSACDSSLLTSKLAREGTACIKALDRTSYDRKGRKVTIARKKRKGYRAAIV